MKNFKKKKKELQEKHIDFFEKNYDFQKRVMNFLDLKEDRAFSCGIEWDNPNFIKIYYIDLIENRIKQANICITKEGMLYKPEYYSGEVLSAEGFWWDLEDYENFPFSNLYDEKKND